VTRQAVVVDLRARTAGKHPVSALQVDTDRVRRDVGLTECSVIPAAVTVEGVAAGRDCSVSVWLDAMLEPCVPIAMPPPVTAIAAVMISALAEGDHPAD
jgi:hypothetical protein